MTRYLTLLILASISLFSCRDEDELLYRSPDNVFFNFDDENTNDRDSVFYTFAYNPELGSDTVFLPVTISGKRIPHDRKFFVSVVDSATTAVPGTHYEPLEAYYLMPADSGQTHIPFIMYSSDPILADTSVSVSMVLRSGEDFGVGFPDFIAAKVVFSNRLEKPEWWDLWVGQLGAYSRTKHQLYLIAVGNQDLISSYADYLFIPRSLFLIDQLRKFINDPFSWAEAHSDEYSLEKVNDQLYYFYSISNPDTKYELTYYPDDAKFYFYNEHNQRVTIN
ncbi:DUF4843 domain-containing protein [Algoriphagus sp. AGSA1]|uniref:DUF4843 domain-containing protein n=1 Tax=Algoriphagus sp. AGSA1 TaxID=2907213 RepID=UPI001F44C131|nr:DUF4843 domain-containing protein [Algoriphagus sp. AGSA1]MCE7054607.1 DUF4843 domain-containing protein [Algoriphagus sp. AGSA1]